MGIAQKRFLLTVTFLVGISFYTVSCKSLAKAHSEPEYGAKQPVSEKKRKTSRSPSRPRKSSHGSSSPGKPVGSVADKKEKPGSTRPGIDDEAFLMNEIPKIQGTAEKKVPGAESVIPADGPISIKEDNANRIIDAGGNDVIVAGDDCVIVITGGCGKLSLNGKNNQIQCDTVKKIEITGDSNTLILGSLGSGTIRGKNNDLSWGSGVNGLSPIVESFGTNNSMKRLE